MWTTRVPALLAHARQVVRPRTTCRGGGPVAGVPDNLSPGARSMRS
jgi:hypothetical protein